MTYREGRFWQPDVTVATVVVRDGRLLVVEERVNGKLVLNQPAGHLEPDESLVDAALRETREETGWDVRPDGIRRRVPVEAPRQAAITCASRSPPSPMRHDPARAAGRRASYARCG